MLVKEGRCYRPLPLGNDRAKSRLKAKPTGPRKNVCKTLRMAYVMKRFHLFCQEDMRLPLVHPCGVSRNTVYLAKQQPHSAQRPLRPLLWPRSAEIFKLESASPRAAPPLSPTLLPARPSPHTNTGRMFLACVSESSRAMNDNS